MNDRAVAILGLFDGLASALGMVLALALQGMLRGLVIAAVAGAVGAGASMAAGEWLADGDSSLRRARMMGGATLLGCLTPAVPFFVTRAWPAYVACAVLTGALGVVVARLRPEAQPESYIKTFSVLAVATTLALGAGAVTGGVA